MLQASWNMAGTVRFFLIYSWFTEGIQIVNSTLLNAYSPIQKYNLDVQEMSEFTSWLEPPNQTK